MRSRGTQGRSYWIVAMTVLCLFSCAEVRGGNAKRTTRRAHLAYELAPRRVRLTIGDPVVLVATIVNNTGMSVTVRPRDLIQYVNWERLPSEGNEFGKSGQIIGEAAPLMDSGTESSVVVAAGASFSRSLELTQSLASALTNAGEYVVSAEYCDFSPKQRTSADECVKSNDVAIIVEERGKKTPE